MKRALVAGCGGLNGAYDAGVLSELGRQLGPTYFDAVYAASAGVFAAAFLVANQPNTIENTWRNLVDGTKAVNFANVFRGRAILDLEYLIEIFQNEKSRLDVEAIFASPVPLTLVVTDYATGIAQYVQPKRGTIFPLMIASAAMPVVHWPVRVGGGFYFDGGLSDPLPAAKAIADGYDHVVAVTNKPDGAYVGKRFNFSTFASGMLPHQTSHLIKTHKYRVMAVEQLMREDSRVTVIRPRESLPLRHILDTDKQRLNETVQRGIDDARLIIPKIREKLDRPGVS